MNVNEIKYKTSIACHLFLNPVNGMSVFWAVVEDDRPRFGVDTTIHL